MTVDQAVAERHLERMIGRMRIASAAGLRNRIVHEYDEIDHDRVFEALGNALEDIPRYLSAVGEYINRQ